MSCEYCEQRKKLKVATVNLSDLETYFKLVKVERDFLHRLHRVKMLSEEKLKVLKDAKQDAEFLRNYMTAGCKTSKFLDEDTKKQVKKILLLHLKTEGVKEKIKEEL